jgi:hypothetical protein
VPKFAEISSQPIDFSSREEKRNAMDKAIFSSVSPTNSTDGWLKAAAAAAAAAAADHKFSNGDMQRDSPPPPLPPTNGSSSADATDLNGNGGFSGLVEPRMLATMQRNLAANSDFLRQFQAAAASSGGGGRSPLSALNSFGGLAAAAAAAAAGMPQMPHPPPPPPPPPPPRDEDKSTKEDDDMGVSPPTSPAEAKETQNGEYPQSQCWSDWHNIYFAGM